MGSWSGDGGCWFGRCRRRVVCLAGASLQRLSWIFTPRLGSKSLPQNLHAAFGPDVVMAVRCLTAALRGRAAPCLMAKGL